MAYLAIQQPRQPRLGRQSERTHEIIYVNIEQLLIVHVRSLPHFAVLCA